MAAKDHPRRSIDYDLAESDGAAINDRACR
jgi:hypothetical protein